MESFNAKEKKTSRITNFVKNLCRTNDSFQAEIESTTYDKKDKEQSTGSYTTSYENGQVRMDLKKLIPKRNHWLHMKIWMLILLAKI